MSIRRVSVASAPAPGGAYAQGVVANGFLYTAGMGPIDPDTGSIVGESVGEQTRRVMRSLGQLLQSQGLSYEHVVKATVHLQDIERDFAEFNEAYSEYFPEGAPVRTTVGSTLLGILVEIDFVAAIPDSRGQA